MLAAAPLAAVQACSDPPTLRLAPPLPDATTASDSSRDEERADALDDTALPPLDAACQVITEILDAGIDVDPPCRYTLPCGIPPENAFVIRGCGLYRAQPDETGDSSLGCAILASDGCENDAYAPPANGSFSFECTDCLGGGGRRPNGLRRPRSLRAATAAGAYFAELAHEEAASVHAFQRLHEELRDLGAPTELVSAAARSIRDETRHARLMARQARRRGGAAPPARVRRQGPRSLESLARENAAEGCVRETYGALLMHWQARHAEEPELRRLFARIAADETRHAALSWEVAAWADTRLDAPARARVAAARRRALRTLARRVEARAPSPVDAANGQPGRAAARALLEGLSSLAIG